MDEVVAALRSKSPLADLARFTESIAARLGAEEAALVLETDRGGGLEVIGARGLESEQALELARELLRSEELTPGQPTLVRDSSDPSDPVAAILSRPRRPQQGARSAGAEQRGVRSALVFAIEGEGAAVGLLFIDRPIGAVRPGYRSAELRDFAFLANGLAAVSRIALSRAESRVRRMYDRLLGIRRQGGIVTRSAALGRILDRLQRAARSDLPILLCGESGTGKELFAHAIHEARARRGRPFVPINCAAIPESLFEAELLATTRGPSPAQGTRAPATSAPRRAAPSSSTRSATCRSRCKPSCSECSRIAT